MFNQDLLMTLPEIALGIVGFAGLVSVFRVSEDDTTWKAADIRSLRSIVELGFFVIFMALLPGLVMEDGRAKHLGVWIMLNVLMAFVLLVLVAQTVYEVFVIRVQFRRPVVVVTVLMLTTFLAGTLLLNTFWGSHELYEATLLFGIAAQAVQFWFLIIGNTSLRNTAAKEGEQRQALEDLDK
ncbi:MAG: hypothetical protein H7Y11_14455 [Armatimonadetes bacterium]|nr:hypothetical protein [Anaerolineae bacterium]